MKIDDLIEKLRDELSEIRARMQVSDAAMEHLNCLYRSIWVEACYDPYNDATRRFAKEMLPHIQALNDELRFKK